MPEQVAQFTPYVEGNILTDDFASPEHAERVADLAVRRMEYLRSQHPLESLRTRSGILAYLSQSESYLRQELTGRPLNSLEHFVAAAFHVQRAAAIELYANQALGLTQRDKASLAVERNTAYAQAQQSVVSVLLAESDRRVLRQATYIYAAVRATPWSRSIKETLGRIRTGVGLSEHQREMVAGLCRGVAGHAAAAHICQFLLGSPQQAYAPSPELDGRHGIDFGLHATPPDQAPIEIVVQAKGKEALSQSVVMTAVAGDRRRPFVVGHSRGEMESLPAAERIMAEREWAIKQLDRGTQRLRREFPHLVDVRQLVGIFIELRAAPFGTPWETIERSREGQFDVTTGLCNFQLFADTEGEVAGLADDIVYFRAAAKRQANTARELSRRLYERPVR